MEGTARPLARAVVVSVLITLLVPLATPATQTTAAPAASTPQAGNEPPRPLSDRGLENLAAFTRLLGYVRFFHPSD